MNWSKCRFGYLRKLICYKRVDINVIKSCTFMVSMLIFYTDKLVFKKICLNELSCHDILSFRSLMKVLYYVPGTNPLRIIACSEHTG